MLAFGQSRPKTLAQALAAARSWVLVQASYDGHDYTERRNWSDRSVKACEAGGQEEHPHMTLSWCSPMSDDSRGYTKGILTF